MSDHPDCLVVDFSQDIWTHHSGTCENPLYFHTIHQTFSKTFEVPLSFDYGVDCDENSIVNNWNSRLRNALRNEIGASYGCQKGDGCCGSWTKIDIQFAVIVPKSDLDDVKN